MILSVADFLIFGKMLLLYCLDRDPWFQICFNKLQTVSAIALQGQGYHNKGHITEYSIKYGYKIESVSYLYSVKGSNVSYSNFVT